MKRNILSHSEAQKILKPHYDKISDAVLAGFADYLQVVNCSVDKIGFVEYEIRTKACLVHDFIKRRINETFYNENEIETGKWNGVFALKISDDLFIRFNKINKDFSNNGYQTRQAKAYRNQRIIDGFPDEPTFLIAGYRPDDSWTQIEGIYVACWDSENLIWVQELLTNKGSYQTALPFNTPDQQPKKRVKIKIGNIPESKTGTDD